MLNSMKRTTILKAGQLLLKVGGVAVGFIFALLGSVLELFTAVEVKLDEDRQLHDSDLSGELIHRSGRLDSGTVPTVGATAISCHR
jgi:tetrahydromethanopterin S-methyltransferase subunit F